MADQDDVGDTLDPALEREAREMGWQPQKEFKGNKEHWVDADAYVERGRKIAPILRANNKKLIDKTLTLETENVTLRTELQSLRKDLDEFRETATKKQVDDKRAALVEQLKEAVKDDDVDAELKIREQIDALKVEPVKKPDPEPKSKDDGLSPEFKSWNKDNPWFGGTSSEDKKKTKEVYRILEDLREEGSQLFGREIMDEATRLWEERNRKSEDDELPSDKHESGNNGAGRRQSGKGFSSLPRAAKEACWEDNERLVGKGKMFEAQKDWEAYYYEQYQAVQ